MAYRNLGDDDEQQAQGAPPAGMAPAPGAAPAAAPSPAAGAPAPSRFVGFQQYLSANQGAAQQSADRISAGVDSAGRDAQQAVMRVSDDVSLGRAPTGAESTFYGPAAEATHNAQTLAANTGTVGGLQTALGTGSAGAGRFDAGLVGAQGAGQFAAQRSRYAGLAGMLSGVGGMQAPRAPGAPTPAPGATPAAPEERAPTPLEYRRQAIQRRLGRDLDVDDPGDLRRAGPRGPGRSIGTSARRF